VQFGGLADLRSTPQRSRKLGTVIKIPNRVNAVSVQLRKRVLIRSRLASRRPKRCSICAKRWLQPQVIEALVELRVALFDAPVKLRAALFNAAVDWGDGALQPLPSLWMNSSK